MASEKSELQWQNVDVENELSTASRKLYHTSKDAYRLYKAARDDFEAAMQSDYSANIPEGSELKFGYNFGKLSVAIGPKTARKAKSEAPKQTLAEFLAAQASDGR